MRYVARRIRSLTPIPLRKAIRRTGEYFGAGLPSPPQFPSIEESLETLHRLGLNPHFCVDIGAYQGEWAKMFKSKFPTSKVFMVEAQETKRSYLEEVVQHYPDQVSMEIALLGATDDQIVEFTEMESGSSVFAEASPYERNIVKRKTSRLDTLLTEGKYPSVDFLKIDVQGYELQVLNGASTALAQATAVLMEASLVPTNNGCPLIAEVIAYMDQAGFRLFDFCSQIRRKDGVLWQTDLLFLRVNSKVLPTELLTHENWG
jgi:FkbM family methyltransferase